MEPLVMKRRCNGFVSPLLNSEHRLHDPKMRRFAGGFTTNHM